MRSSAPVFPGGRLLVALAVAPALLFPPRATSQAVGVIEGTVRTVDIGEGVPGVWIRLSPSGLATVTDADGRFRLSGVPEGEYRLRSELVGCAPTTFPLNVGPTATARVDIVLDGPAIASSGPSVAAGVAGETPAAEVPFSVARLERSELAHDPGRSIADLIRGSFPGVKVVQGSGVPGSPISIQLRGPRSLSGSQDPLVVVDQVITGGGFDDLDPFDVERIEVLKGAAGAALYGARGQAGVIEITTRRAGTVAAPRCYLVGGPN